MADSPKKALGDSPVAVQKSADLSRPSDTKPAETTSDPAERVAAALRSIVPASVVRVDSRTNPLLDQLVYGDNDLVGLVAYAMHEVNRRDWRNAYEAAHGRAPSDADFNAYLVGEQLERRLETYRRLAEDAIAKVATGDTNLRRLAEGAPEIARVSAPVLSSEPRVGLPAPLTGASRTLQATNADKAVVQPARKREMGKLALYLTFLLIAVAGLAWILRFGIDASQPIR